jgi:hypothetical protein
VDKTGKGWRAKSPRPVKLMRNVTASDLTRFLEHSIAFTSLFSFSTEQGQDDLHGLDRNMHALWKGTFQWALSQMWNL